MSFWQYINVLILCQILLNSYCFSAPAPDDIHVNEIELAKVLSTASGIYLDSGKADQHKGTILVTACNHAYLNHFHNFKCFADRLRIKFVVFAFDSKTYKYLAAIPDVNVFFLNLHATEGNSEFRRGDFNKISVGKFHAVYEAMKLGYNVIFSDPDVAILRDPLPLFEGSQADYIHSVNARCSDAKKEWEFYWSKSNQHEGNTGFYYIKSNNKTLPLYRDFFKTVPKPGEPFDFLDDQTLFWKYFRDPSLSMSQHQGKSIFVSPGGKCPSLPPAASGSVSSNRSPYHSSRDRILAPSSQSKLLSRSGFVNPANMNRFGIRTCHLDMCQFPAGAVSTPDFLIATLSKLRTNQGSHRPLYALHANYLKGNENKQKRLAEEGLWLATRSEATGRWTGKCADLNATSAPRVAPFVF